MSLTLDGRAAAQVLHDARAGASAVPQLSHSEAIDLAAAYRIQAEGIALRRAAGEQTAGIKLGLTSQAKMAQVGVTEVIFGELTDAMSVADGGTVDVAGLIHPRAEPEVAFRLGRDVPPDEPLDSAVSAYDSVAAAVEIIDSRYADFQFTLADVVADNASAAGYVVGSWQSFGGGSSSDISNRGVLLEVDGAVVQTGTTAAILGDPRRALRSAITLARALDVPLVAGQVLLAGAATAAVPLAPGQHLRAVVSGIGTASLRAEAQ